MHACYSRYGFFLVAIVRLNTKIKLGKNDVFTALFDAPVCLETVNVASVKVHIKGDQMKMGGIDASRIEAMVAQLKATAAKMEASAGLGVSQTENPAPAKLDFSEALKASLDSVNQAQTKSQQLGQKFAMGDDKVSLSDVMISMQKSSIAFQTTVQVRNKLVSAYHDIMNMQI